MICVDTDNRLRFFITLGVLMKKVSIVCAALLLSVSLAACSNQSSSSKAPKQHHSTTSKVVKKNKKSEKHKEAKNKNKNKDKKVSSNANSSNSSAANSTTTQTPTTQQNDQNNDNSTTAQNNGAIKIHNASEAVAYAQAQYGDDGGTVHWTYMIDAGTNQPIQNPDGSWFVKGVNDQTMSGTVYSLNVFPDGTITEN